MTKDEALLWVPLQGGLSNAELDAAWKRKLPEVKATENEMAAFAVGVEVGFDHARLNKWMPADVMPPPRRPGDFESRVVLAVAETDDGSLQITPAKVAALAKREWREVRFDHNGQGRKIVVRCWTRMPAFPAQAVYAKEATR